MQNYYPLLFDTYTQLAYWYICVVHAYNADILHIKFKTSCMTNREVRECNTGPSSRVSTRNWGSKTYYVYAS